MNSNVVQLFADDELPNISRGEPLDAVLDVYIEWARKAGADVNSTKFTYDCATIMTLMQLATRGE